MNMSLKGNDTIIDMSNDDITKVEIDTEQCQIKYMLSTDKSYIIKLSEAVFFTLINTLKEA